jgi:methylated-DNA-protein-cysteine methyltransferase-like protein
MFGVGHARVARRNLKSKSGKKTSGRKATGIVEGRRARVVRCIRRLPIGKVSSYGAIASAAGWAGAARQVVRILRESPGLPWHRVVGAGGAIKLQGENGAEQKLRLRMEGVTFRGTRVDMKKHEFRFAKTGKTSPKKTRHRGGASS